MLRRKRNQLDKSHHLQAKADIEAMGDYNAFSRPRPSSVKIISFYSIRWFLFDFISYCIKTMPLRSVFLDPDVNNCPPSKTRTELLKRIKLTNIPHPTYDLVMLIFLHFRIKYKIIDLLILSWFGCFCFLRVELNGLQDVSLCTHIVF